MILRSLAGWTSTVAAMAAVPGVALAAPPTGDWEASGPHGAVASFALGRAGGHGRLAVTDLVVQTPIVCANAFGSPDPVDTEVIAASAPLRGGSFSEGGALRAGHSGTSVRAVYRDGAFSLSYRHVEVSLNAYEGGTETCTTGTVRLRARHAVRRALKDGLYEGRSDHSQPVELDLVAGGRVLETSSRIGPGGVAEDAFSLSGANASDPCGDTITSPLFIAPDGSFTNAAHRQGDDVVLTGRLTRARGRGQYSNMAENCSLEGWSASWLMP